jgi:hypothetical protein
MSLSPVILSPSSVVILSPSFVVILSEAKDLLFGPATTTASPTARYDADVAPPARGTV